jgi:3-oxoacyl-[acyl-carrier protein] reductase
VTQSRDQQRGAALVIGGARGIGLAISEQLRGAGYQVYATTREPPNSGTSDCVTADGINLVRMDIDQPESIASVQSLLRERGIVPQVLIANAGITNDQLFPTCDFAAWEAVVGTNLIGTARAIRTFIPNMVKAKAGRVVIIASISGIRGSPGQTAYSASKAGLIAFARTLAREVGRFGLTVNCVSPGIIRGGMTDKIPEKLLQERIATSALRRLGSARDVAEVVLTLCGPAGEFITGQNLIVDGGIVMQ